MTFLVLLLFWGAIGFSSLFVEHFSFNRWDNFEYYTPTMLETHGRWLRGQIPLWSSHQQLGESLLAGSQAGIFYAPNTLAAWAVKIFNAPGHYLFLLAIFHLSVGFLGWLRLFNRLGVRRVIAYACSISVLGGGYVSLIIPVWTFVGAFICWMPWVLYGAVMACEDKLQAGAIWLPLGLAMAALAGSPQHWFYLLLWAGLFVFLLGWCRLATVASYRRFGLLFLAGALLGAPALWPVYVASKSTVRASALPLGTFLERSVPLKDLLSTFLPTAVTSNTFLPQRGCVSFFQGAWIPVAIFQSLLLCRVGTSISKYVKVAFSITAVFVLFSLGGFGGIYPLTYGIPIWSSFRWPFKFLLFANASMAITAALALELLSRARDRLSPLPSRSVVVWAGLAVTGGMAVWGFRSQSSPTLAVLFAGTGLLSIALLPVVNRKWAGGLFVVLSLLTAGLNQVLTQRADLKFYREPVGKFGADYWRIDKSYRVIPVSAFQGEPAMQPLGLFQSATIGGYDGATGCTTALVPSWLVRYFGSDDSGLFPAADYDRLLRSHFLKALNVRYALARNGDDVQIKRLEKAGFRLVTQREKSSLYEQSGALPRLYFASSVRPFMQSNDDLLDNRVDVRTAFVSDVEGKQELPRGDVLEIQPMNNGVKARVQAPEGGLLVFSSTYYPDWKVFIDGKNGKIIVVNGLVMGVRVPPRCKDLMFLYRPKSLYASLFLFAGGLLLLGTLIVRGTYRLTFPVNLL